MKEDSNGKVEAGTKCAVIWYSFAHVFSERPAVYQPQPPRSDVDHQPKSSEGKR